MFIKDVFGKGHTAISFEFFPPKTDRGWETIYKTIAELRPLNPAYVSVTYGAGGSTRGKTHDLVKKLGQEQNLAVAAHLTCVGSSRDEVEKILEEYKEDGINNILALRGDLPDGQNELNSDGKGFNHAIDLVAFIRERQPEFGIGAACFPEGHPSTPNRLIEMDYLKAKVDAGVDYLVTQMFFDNRDYYDFCERCVLAGINIPVVAGIMPITSRKGLQRMASLSAGSRFPARLLKALGRAESDEMVKNVGIQWATEQVRDLLDNEAPGVHLYTLNHSRASLKICEMLGLRGFGNL